MTKIKNFDTQTNNLSNYKQIKKVLLFSIVFIFAQTFFCTNKSLIQFGKINFFILTCCTKFGGHYNKQMKLKKIFIFA